MNKIITVVTESIDYDQLTDREKEIYQSGYNDGVDDSPDNLSVPIVCGLAVSVGFIIGLILTQLLS